MQSQNLRRHHRDEHGHEPGQGWNIWQAFEPLFPQKEHPVYLQRKFPHRAESISGLPKGGDWPTPEGSIALGVVRSFAQSMTAVAGTNNNGFTINQQ